MHWSGTWWSPLHTFEVYIVHIRSLSFGIEAINWRLLVSHNLVALLATAVWPMSHSGGFFATLLCSDTSSWPGVRQMEHSNSFGD